MALRIAVTGSPGVGKSTLVAKVTSGTKLRVGGVLARDRRYKDRRTGFELLDLSTGMVGILADESGDGPQLGKYRVHLDDLDLIGAQAVENALGCDLIVVPKPMLVVLHQWSNHRLAKKIRGSFRVLTVTRENRDSLADEIAKALKSG